MVAFEENFGCKKAQGTGELHIKTAGMAVVTKSTWAVSARLAGGHGENAHSSAVKTQPAMTKTQTKCDSKGN